MRKSIFADTKQKLRNGLVAAIFITTQIAFPFLTSGIVKAASPPSEISVSTHQGQTKTGGVTGGYTAGNVTEYTELESINFRFHIESDGTASGKMQVEFTSNDTGCLFFDGTFHLGTYDGSAPQLTNTTGSLPSITPAGPAVNNGSDWVQVLNVSYPAAGSATVNYYLTLSDNAGECSSGSPQHSRLANTPNGGSFKNIGQQNVPIPANQIIELPEIYVQKWVDRDGDGTAESKATSGEWSFSLDGGSPIATDANGKVTFNNVTPNGNHTVTETNGPSGQAFLSGGGTNCSFTGSTATATVASGTTSTDATCIFNNGIQKGSITLVKNVINDNGGTASANDFGLTVGGTPVTSGQTLQLNAGSYTINEAGLTGYDFTGITGAGCPTQLGGTVSLSGGQHVTCTITNDDIAPLLLVTKRAINDNGGTKMAPDFSLYVNDSLLTSADAKKGGGDVYDSGITYEHPNTAANVAYTVSEDSTDGYSPQSKVCVDKATGLTVAQPVTLQLGQTVECTITNNDVAPVITIIKQVLNPYGTSTALPDSFNLTLGGDVVLSGANTTVSAGTSYTVGETTTGTGYTFTSFTGEHCTYSDGIMSAIGVIGGHTTCTVTNTAIQPKLIVKKHVVNNNGGTKSADDFNITVSGTNVSNTNFPGNEDGTVIHLNEGSYSVDETGNDGYTKTLGTDCSGTISIGQTKTCTITNDDKPGKLTVNKVVENGVYGDAEASDFSFKLNGDDTSYNFVNGETTTEGSKTVELNAGTYTATENEAFGYDSNDSDCKNVVVTNGNEASCTITNTAQRKVTICHATDANSNPYVRISVPVSAIDGVSGNQANDPNGDHFAEHKGPIWYPGIDGKWGDIIPPLEGIHDGLNWTAYGQATLENDCNPPAQVIVTKYNDLNRNGMQDEGEPTLPNWDMTLTCELNDFLSRIAVETEQNAPNCEDVTQTTGADGTTTFMNVLTNNKSNENESNDKYSHTLFETIPEGSNWNLSNIDCGEEQGGLDGSTYYFASIGLGETIHCYVGNYQDTGTVTVIKKLTPSTDQGKFNLNINGKTYATNVGDGGSTGAITLVTGDVTASETAGTNTTLGDYEASYKCVDGEGTVTSGTGSSLAFNLKTDQNVVCTFYNNKGEILGATAPTAPLVNTGINILTTSLVSLVFISSVAGLGIVTRRRTTTQ